MTYPTKPGQQCRVVGKTLEELGELTAVVARLQIQGIDEIDPSSGKTNRQRLEEEMADVSAQFTLLAKMLGLDIEAMHTRADRKMADMAEWERLMP